MNQSFLGKFFIIFCVTFMTRVARLFLSPPAAQRLRHVPARAARVCRQEAVFRSARLPALPAVPAYRRSPQTLVRRRTPSNLADTVPEHKTSTSHVSRGRRRPFIGDPLSSARARTSRTGVPIQTRPSSPRAQLLKNPVIDTGKNPEWLCISEPLGRYKVSISVCDSIHFLNPQWPEVPFGLGSSRAKTCTGTPRSLRSIILD